jgi:hypothetical protein
LNSSFCTLSRSVVHQIPNAATLEVGSDFVIAGNKFYDIVLANTNGKSAYFQSSPAPSAHIAWFLTNANGSFRDWNYRRQYLQNSLKNSWGEGYNCMFTDTCDVIGNTFSLINSVHIYLDHTRNARILRNSIAEDARPGDAIAINNEAGYNGVPAMSQSNILIADNFIGQMAGFALFRYDGMRTATDTWSNLHLVNNVFAGGGRGGNTFYFQKVGGGTPPHGGVISGNIFLKGSQGLFLQDGSAWTVEHNVFEAGTPAITAGASVANNITASPQFVGPTDGSSFAGFTPSNPASLQVPASAEVPVDALCKPRNTTNTTAGVVGP